MSKIDKILAEIQRLKEKAYDSLDEERRARFHEVITLYDQLIDLSSDKIYYQDSQARIYYELKEYSNAEACFLKVLQVHPKSTTTLWMLSLIYFDSKQYTKALESVDQCIANTIGAEFRYDLRAKINRALGNEKEAEHDQRVYDDYQAKEQSKWDDPNHYYHYK